MNKEVNFEIAKLLKDKAFDEPTLHLYFEDGILVENCYEDTTGMDYGSAFTVEFSELIDNWNKGWVRKKDGSMCFGCDKSKGYLDIYSAPIISEVIMWIYEKYNIWIHVNFANKKYWYFDCNNFGKDGKEKSLFLSNYIYNSPTKAYEAAILYTLNNLI